MLSIARACACLVVPDVARASLMRLLALQVKMLKELKPESEDDAAVYKALVEELTQGYPAHLPLLTATLAGVASLPAEKRKERLQVTRLVAHHTSCVSPAGWPPWGHIHAPHAAAALQQDLWRAPVVCCCRTLSGPRMR